MSLLAQPGFAVSRIVAMHPKQTAVTLNIGPLGTQTQLYASSYGFPEDEHTGLGQGSTANQTGVIYLHQLTETLTPVVDDWITKADGVTKCMIRDVKKSLNFQTGGAVWECHYYRAG